MTENKQMLLIVNPRSGRGSIRTKLTEVLDIFQKAGYEIQVHITQAVLDAKNAVTEKGNRFDLIVCCGGDGTLNETVSGLMELEEPPLLGYIPAGSTNDFASSLQLPRQILTAASTAVSGTVFPVDVGRFCKDRYFVYVAGFGAFTEISYVTPQDKKNILGHQAYMLEGVKGLASIKTYQMRASWEDNSLEGEFIFGMVTNTISVGGFKGLVNQNVALNDGLFEVLLIRAPKTPLELSNIIAQLLIRDGEPSELVYKFKTSSLTLESEEEIDWVLDGEFGGSRKTVTVENLSQRLKIRKSSPKKRQNIKI